MWNDLPIRDFQCDMYWSELDGPHVCFRPLLALALLPVVLAIQFDPIEDHTESECALLLDGPGRSSSFDYNVNTLRGTV